MAKRSKHQPASDASPEAPLFSGEVVQSDWLMVLLRAALIIGAGSWVYSPVFHGDWIWDDDWYITSNPLLRDPSSLWKFWFQPGVWVEYYPIDETVLWIEWHWFGTDTLGYHLVTISLHLLDALLVWRLLGKLGVSKAWLGGLIFAVHPACVDSVAWIVEIKNTLSLAPFLLAMSAWVDFEERRAPRAYILALVFFTTALLTKISATPFPLVILLYAWWKRGRIAWGDLAASAPFFAVSLALGTLSISSVPLYYQSIGQVAEPNPIIAWPSRLVLAGQSLGVYFAHCVWPVNLRPIYPKWPVDPSSPIQFLPILLVAMAFVFLWQKRATWGRHGLLGLGFFIIFLGPFLGFMPVSYMNFTWVMDHLLYIAIIGPIGLVAAAIGNIETRLPANARITVTASVTALVALLAFEAHAYATAYINGATLWSNTVALDPGSYLAHYNLGNALIRSGSVEEAIEQYQQALALKPDYDTAHNNLGVALIKSGRAAEAEKEFEAAVQISPYYPEAQANLAKVKKVLAAPPPNN